jgi:hypothetical protein
MDAEFLEKLSSGIKPELRCHGFYYVAGVKLGYSDVYVFTRNERGEVRHYWFDEARRILADIEKFGICRVIDELV